MFMLGWQELDNKDTISKYTLEEGIFGSQIAKQNIFGVLLISMFCKLDFTV